MKTTEFLVVKKQSTRFPSSLWARIKSSYLSNYCKKIGPTILGGGAGEEVKEKGVEQTRFLVGELVMVSFRRRRLVDRRLIAVE